MKSTIINGKKVKLQYRYKTSGVLTVNYHGKHYHNINCNIYGVEGDQNWVVLVLVTDEFKDIPKSLTLVTAEDFRKLVDKFGGHHNRSLLHVELIKLCGGIEI